ncbi:MAG TPA: formyltransferase family protein [Dyella sp.]|uniref:formyltransferase family protein n=1 Tax=Dyella sp. TaxID=1869338 RepID=UPI002D787BF0|nr:formyltransferase family protein [Dyella sp.]HET6554396.1 formyltransferase family protein [Dyella sp.]
MRTMLICHEGDDFDRVGLAAWLGSFSELAGVVVLVETPAQKRARVRREIRRVGWLRFLDVVAMRLYQRVALAGRDRAWTAAALVRMREHYGVPPTVPQLVAADVNDAAVAVFLRQAAPDIVLARCKQLLKKHLIAIPRVGCFVLHPGICPEYRNAHGCFWALSQRDLERVGMTLLKVDAGVDTGPVYGYYSYPFDERHESHVVIQYRVVLENLDRLAQRFREIFDRTASVVDTRDRRSGTWGQPWLSRYLRWQRAAKAAGP